MKSPFIVIDGGEGAGKSTQIKKLKQAYPKAMFTREPGGSAYAEAIRELLLYNDSAEKTPAVTKLLLFFAARADHLTTLVIPAIQAGRPVICDRFDSSSFAYQIFGEERAELLDLFFRLRKSIVSPCPPDLYLYLDIDPKIGIKRKTVQAKDGQEKLNYFDKAKIEFHDRMRKGYADFFGRINEKSVKIDASQSVEKVYEQIVSAINPLLP